MAQGQGSLSVDAWLDTFEPARFKDKDELRLYILE
jgi:hypothetical protein